jgi:hypothetical protein
LAHQLLKRQAMPNVCFFQSTGSANDVAQITERTRPTSHVAAAQPAPVKKPTQAQTIISSTVTFVGI